MSSSTDSSTNVSNEHPATKLAIINALKGLQSHLQLIGDKRSRDSRPYDFAEGAQKCLADFERLMRFTNQSLSTERLNQFGWTNVEELREQVVFCLAIAFCDGDPNHEFDDLLAKISPIFGIHLATAKLDIEIWQHAAESQRTLDRAGIPKVDISESCVVSANQTLD